MYNNPPDAKGKIMSAARDVFRRYGYIKVSMDDIAGAAGMGRSSLYYYYKSKGAVFGDVVAKEISDIMASARQKVSKSNTLEKNIVIYQQVKIKLVEIRFKELDHILQDLRRNTELLFHTEKHIRCEEEKMFLQIVGWGIENKEIPGGKGENMKTQVSGIIDALSVFGHELFLFGKVERFMPRLKNLTMMACKWLG